MVVPNRFIITVGVVTLCFSAYLVSRPRVGGDPAPTYHVAAWDHVQRLHEEGKSAGLHTEVKRIFGRTGSDEAVQVVTSSPRPAPEAVNAAWSAVADSRTEAQLPKDFSWQSYLDYHPELLARNVTTRAEVEQHFLQHGWRAKKVWWRLRVILRYTAGGGLCNQQYMHISAFMVAVAMGMEVVLPTAHSRDSFNHSTLDETQWNAVAANSLWDTAHIKAYWRRRGITVHETPRSEDPHNGLPTRLSSDRLPDINETHVTEIGGTELTSRDLDELVAVVRGAAVRHAETLLQNGIQVPYIVVYMPGPLFAVKHVSAPALAVEVAMSLRFAPALRAAASNAVLSVGSNPVSYNSLHLRVETDASHWVSSQGGLEAALQQYVQAAQQLNFTSDLPVVVASGIFTYDTSADADNIEATLLASGICNSVQHKELLMEAEAAPGLHPVQLAVIDLLLMTRGLHFVGLGSSTFSNYVMFARFLEFGYPLGTNILVDGNLWLEGLAKLI